MMRSRIWAIGASLVLQTALVSLGEVKVVVDHNDNDQATSDFKFKNVPSPSKTDAAAKAKFSIINGERDDNGGGLDKLHDGAVPTEADQPGENFFFNAGTPGGRIGIDFGTAIEIKQINTYSWHPATRGPQVYKVYGSDGQANDFKDKPASGTDPATCGWKLIASVDTRPKQGNGGGQYGVGISDSAGAIGKYRYLLFDMSRTEDADDFGNTFYSEIDVNTDQAAAAQPPPPPIPPEVFHTPDGKYQVTLDMSRAPDLKDWADKELMPVVLEWYPKLVDMLPSEGYAAPEKFSITFRNGRGVAATGGTRITCDAPWFKRNLKGEARGAVVHEMVHVVQQYGRARRTNPNAKPTPGWLVEGIPDYLRWYKYEPELHGADRFNKATARYDGAYRVSANFLNYVVEKYDKDIIVKVNAALREGKYTDDLWKQYTGKTVQELGAEWKAGLQRKAA